MKIPEYHSIQLIKKQYGTGEEPVLAICSDLNEYICKYVRSSGTPYKLVCEVIGAIFASEWGLKIPDFAFIRLLPEHWTPFRSINLSAPSFGSKVQHTVVDITGTSNKNIVNSPYLQKDILDIALFDLWLANEDRNWNNANLLYDIEKDELIVIDHGCILNTATFDYKMSLLTQNETILYSDLAHYILHDFNPSLSNNLLFDIKLKFHKILLRKQEITTQILDNIPKAWNVNLSLVKSKIDQLFDQRWIDDCWGTFVEYIKETKNE